jgi:energy-coupling factor transport system permease protein
VNARALAAWSAACLVVVFASTNPVYRGLVLLAALNVVMARRLPGHRSRGLAQLIAVGALLSVGLNLLLSHSGSHVLATVPGWFPGLGGALTAESLAFGVDAGLALAATMLAVAPMTLALEPEQLVDALPSAVNRTGAAVAAALNIVPVIGRSLTAIREAQRMRGWRPRGLRSWSEVLVPAMLTAMEDSIQLAEAMEARGFGSGPRTRFRPRDWRPFDVAAAVLAGFVSLSFVGARFGGLLLDWYPYPDLTIPAVNPFLALGVLLLALPGLRWRSQASGA